MRAPVVARPDPPELDNLCLGEAPRILLERLDYENVLLAQRTTWIVASQAFLLSAYAGCIIGANGEQGNPHVTTLELLVRILPWTALISLFGLYVTVTAGLVAIAKLRRAFARIDATGRLIAAESALARRMGLVAPLLVPPVFLVTWAAVLVHG
jgi:hypothetical protein